MDDQRAPYHHGDLRHALIEAGVALVRGGGVEALGLREVARRVGVSPTSAYRHFANHAELILAVKVRALEWLAASIQKELAGDNVGADSLEAPDARFRAVGTGYVRFARAEPGLYVLALAQRDIDRPPYTGQFQVGAFKVLGRLLDELVKSGELDERRRPQAEIRIWAALHGLAMLLISGPLMTMSGSDMDEATNQMLDMLLRGL